MSDNHFGTPSYKDIFPSRARRISRRTFGQRAATVAALSFDLAPAKLLVAREDSRGKSPATEAGSAPETAQDVDAKLANIIRKYGTRLSAAQREHLRRILVYNEKLLAGVRALSLQNGDPPASVLKISWAEDDAHSETRRP